MDSRDYTNRILRWAARWIFWIAILSLPFVVTLQTKIEALGAPPVIVLVGQLALLILPALLFLWALETIQWVVLETFTPLSFCLPGFREPLRREYFRAAVLIGVAASMLPLYMYVRVSGSREVSSSAHVDPGGLCLRMAAGFMLGMALYLIVGTRRFIFPRWAWGIIQFLPVALVLVGLGTLLPLFTDDALASAISIPACAVTCLFIWGRMGDMARVKQAHRLMLEPRRARHDEAQDMEATSASWVEGSFQVCMERRRYLGLGRYLCGSLYEQFEALLSAWKWVLPALAVAALAVVLIGNEIARLALLLSGWAVALLLDLPTTSVLLLPAGRRERYRATLALAGAGLLLSIGISAVVGLLSEVLALCLAVGFSWRTAQGLFSGAAGPASIFLPCLVVPVLLSARLIGHRYPKTESILGTIMFLSLFLVLFWYTAWPASPMLAVFVPVFALGWILFLLVLWAACRRWDLG